MLRICFCLSLFLSIIMLAVSASSELGVAVNWGAYTNPILDHDGAILGDQCLLQLLWDADRDGIDEPGENGRASGGDRVLDVSYTRAGSFFEGMASQNSMLPDIAVGDQVYVRAWNGRDAASATYYGDTRDLTSPVWRVKNGLSLTIDATGEKSWGTTMLWSPQSMLLWRVERKYSVPSLHCGPNPCNDLASFRFSVPGNKVTGVSDDGDNLITHFAGSDRAMVRLSVYDASGRLVRVVSEEQRLAGHHTVVWDLRDQSGMGVASGRYFVNLAIRTGQGVTSSLTKQMVVVK